MGWGSGLALVVLSAGCEATPAARPRASGGWSDTPAAASAAAPRREERWPLAEQLASLRPAVPRARSQHLGGDHEGEVLARDAGGYPILRGPESKVPVGATLVERVFEVGAREPTAYFVMIKRPPGYDPAGSDWEYLAVTPGGLVDDRGKLGLCSRCHAEAPHDHVFGGGR